MNKKSLSIFLVLIMLLLMFASGCTQSTSQGSKTSQPAKSDSTASTTADTKQEEDTVVGYTLPIVKEPISLTFLCRESSTPGTSFMSDKAPLIWQEFEKKTGIKIIFDAKPSNELSEVVQLRLAAKQDVPDMIIFPAQQDGAYLAKHYSDGSLIALNEYIDKYAVNMQKIFKDYPEYKSAMTLPDGSIVGLGNMVATKYSFRTQAIRKDWLDRLGLSMPTTPDELINVAKAFIQNDMNGNGQADEIGMSGYGTQWKELGHAWGLHYVTGDGWTVRNGKVTFEPVTEEYKDFLKFLRRCVQEGVFPADWASVDKSTHTARLINSQCGIEVRADATNIINYLDETNSMRKNNPDAEWRLIPPLDGPYGKGILVKEPVAQRWRTLVVTSANKYPAETVKWLDYTIFSEEGQMYKNYGIEGLTYEIENGKIKKLPSDLHQNKPAADGSWLGYGDYLPMIQTNEIVEMGFSHIVPNPDESHLVQEIKSMWPYVEEPFVPPIPEVEDGKRLSALLADIKTYVDEMFYKFVSGDVDIDAEFDNYVKKLQSVGLSEVIEIYQKGYDKINK